MMFYLLVSATIFGLFELIAEYIPSQWAFVGGFITSLLFVILSIVIIRNFG